MATVSREQAVAHPNWRMGAKISIDSATMMNKGLELIEAAFLFDMPSANIEVVVHPQSIIHSMVEYEDGSVLAQLEHLICVRRLLMRWLGPNRISSPSARFGFWVFGSLNFESPDPEKFTALTLAREALVNGGSPQRC